MSNKKVALELVKIAKLLSSSKEVQADHGDITVYFNVYDLVKFDKDFENDEGVNVAQSINGKIYQESFLNKWDRDVKDLVKKMYKNGELPKGCTPKN